ncbi:MAG: DUF1566 domain-containing protein [Methanothrix sp.]|nr:DUF1566 domain-containing protein [Methanothrix sp.]
MKKVCFVALALTFIPCLTVAGEVELPRAGQMTCWDANANVIDCYGTGQDGDIRAGVAWPNPRFTDNGDDTMTDNLTGLMWTKNGKAPGPTTCGPGTLKSWQDALNYVRCLNTTENGYLGYTDWRLPNVNELESLVNAEQSNIGLWLRSQGFTYVYSDSYWSSTSLAGYEGYALTVFLQSGEFGTALKSNAIYVWPVRAGGSGSFRISLPKTGQTSCYDASGSSIACTGTGQDGDLQMGSAWPGTRFVDNGDQTVTDNLTGLVWARSANVMKIRDPGFDNDSGPGTPGDGAVTWQHALDYIKKLNQESYLGYNDWRLPNRKEGGSLRHYGESDSYWWKTQGFTNIEEINAYWSCTSMAYSHPIGPAAWELVPGLAPKSYSRLVLPVRGGQVLPIVTLTIIKSGKGSGSITADLGTISWNGNTGTVTYRGGTTIILTATPDSGSNFAGWSGGCLGRDTCGITANTNTQVTADFSIKGDVNSDGAVDLTDVNVALQVMSGIPLATAVDANADVNGDKKIGTEEIIYILQKMAGIRQ